MNRGLVVRDVDDDDRPLEVVGSIFLLTLSLYASVVGFVYEFYATLLRWSKIFEIDTQLSLSLKEFRISGGKEEAKRKIED